jgi:hypothetical protein
MRRSFCLMAASDRDGPDREEAVGSLEEGLVWSVTWRRYAELAWSEVKLGSEEHVFIQK